MFRRKLLYVGRAGRGDVVLRLGAALDSRLWVADGGVRGREFDPDTLLFVSAASLLCLLRAAYNELKLRMSACEYAAPMTFLLCDELDVFDVVRQKGDADLFACSQQAIIRRALLYIRRTIYVKQSKLLATPML